MVGHHPLGRLTHPLKQREILEFLRLEDLEHFNRLLVAQVLDEVTHVAGDDTNVAGHVVERPGGAVGGEDGDTSAALDEEGPFIGVGVPVHLAHGARSDVQVSGGDGLGDGEVGRVGDADQTARGVEGFLVEHLVGELQFGLFHVGAFGFFVLDGARQGALEDVFLLFGDRLEDFGRELEVLGQNGLGGVL